MQEERTEAQSACYIEQLNSDCLSEVFRHLALLPLTNSPKFTNNVKDARDDLSTPKFMEITAQSHQNLHLLACCLVSRQWYEVARQLLWHTIVIRTKDHDTWCTRLLRSIDVVPIFDSGTVPSSGPRNWVRNLTIIGGNSKIISMEEEPPTNSNQNLPILALFPCIQELTVFGMGWGTSAIFGTAQLGVVVATGVLTTLRKLTITATSEYLLKGAPVGRNWTELMALLPYLPKLQWLSLQGFIYRALLAAEQKGRTPTFNLVELKLQDCQLGYEIFEWLIRESLETLKTLEMPDTSVWKVRVITPIGASKDERGEKTARRMERGGDLRSTQSQRMEVMEKRLGVDLPIFEVCRKS